MDGSPGMNFTEWVDLAAEQVGGKALAASDEFFAPKENLLKPGRGVFIEGKYTSRGKWMDGWETRRKRVPGHDWCVIRLGLPGIVRGVNVDTNHFLGNYPEFCSVDGCRALRKGTVWTEILPKTRLQGGAQNLSPIHSPETWTHIRLNIYPDGGVARLRVHGEVVFDLKALARSGRLVDLAAAAHGGFVLASNDMFFGPRNNLILPGRAKTMAEGWETRRRRGPGHDWCVIRLGHPGVIEKVEVDTSHFRGNYPESCSLEGALAQGAEPEDFVDSDRFPWVEILPRVKLRAHARHLFSKEVRKIGPFTHVRFNIYPDGGVSRLRLYGRLRAP